MSRKGTVPCDLSHDACDASGDHHWRPIQTCSLQGLPHPGTDIYWWPHTVGKRAVRILLECCLVCICKCDYDLQDIVDAQFRIIMNSVL